MFGVCQRRCGPASAERPHPRYAARMELGPETLRTISHDMRNLLTAVRGHAELALRGLSHDDPAREDVAHAVVVTAALFELIDQLDGHDPAATLVAVNLDSTVNAMRRLLDALLPTSVEMRLEPEFGGRPRHHLQAPRGAHRPQPGDERPGRHGPRRLPGHLDQPWPG